MIRHMTRAGSMVLLLVAALYPGAAVAHEGMDLEVDPCVRWVGESAVHFNAYQPQYELKAQYCTDIPKTGETFLVVDLVDLALRNVPVGLRIVRGNGSSEAEAQTVADWRPSHHPTGVVSGEATLDEGLYRVIITAEGRNPSRYQYLLRVQMIDYQKLMRSVVVPLLGVLLLAWLGYKLIRSKWLRNWWSVLRSQEAGVLARNGLVYIEHTFDQPGKFVGLVIVGGKQEHVSRGLFSIGESKMSSRNIMAAHTAIAGGAVIFFALRGSRKGKQFRARVRKMG